MANFNKVILLGNLTRDIELTVSKDDLPIAKFGMAINRKSTKDGREKTCFVDLTAFGKTAETLKQYVSKGSALFIEGKLEYSSWDDKNTGTKRSKLEVVVDTFQFIGSKTDEVLAGVETADPKF